MALIARQRQIVLTIGFAVTLLAMVSYVLANPTDPNVTAGQATIAGLGTSAVTIHQATQQAIINWQHFNIAPNEVTRFIQPNASSIALNRIFDQNPSQIFGSLQANGNVILLNPNGILFGPNAQVNVGGLIASSLNLTDGNFLRGNYLFQGTGIEGWVKNAGSIQGATGVYLLAPNVENSGIITSPGGNIVLGAGATAYLSNRPDGRGFLAEITAPTGQAVNLKDLIADGGNITLAGQVVNQQGLIQANSVRQQNGKIELYASDTLTLGAGSLTIAKGDQQGISDGGTIIAVADKSNPNSHATFQQGAVIDVSGGAQGGNGGSIELSGASVSMGGNFIGTAQPGYHGGELLIDPTQNVDISGLSTNGLDITLETPRDAQGNLLAGYDLRVTGAFDMANLT
ncbi:two-partner secretion domain-containing protein, partial [Petrachloros mirabilis]